MQDLLTGGIFHILWCDWLSFLDGAWVGIGHAQPKPALSNASNRCLVGRSCPPCSCLISCMIFVCFLPLSFLAIYLVTQMVFFFFWNILISSCSSMRACLVLYFFFVDKTYMPVISVLHLFVVFDACREGNTWIAGLIIFRPSGSGEARHWLNEASCTSQALPDVSAYSELSRSSVSSNIVVYVFSFKFGYSTSQALPLFHML